MPVIYNHGDGMSFKYPGQPEPATHGPASPAPVRGWPLPVSHGECRQCQWRPAGAGAWPEPRACPGHPAAAALRRRLLASDYDSAARAGTVAQAQAAAPAGTAGRGPGPPAGPGHQAELIPRSQVGPGLGQA